RLCEKHFKEAPELGEAVATLTNDPDALMRMQVAYTLGEWDDARAGKALAELAGRGADDRFLVAAVLSSVNERNLDAVLTAAVGDGKTLPPAALLEPLLRVASARKDGKAVARLLDAVARPQDGRFTAAQFLALGGLLDALASRQTSLAALAKEAKGELKDSLAGTAKMFDAARKLAGDEKAAGVDRLAAVRVLGRGPDRQDEDIDLLAGLLVPQTPVEIQSGVVAALGGLYGPKVPGALLRHWRGHGPALRVQVLEVLSRRQEWLM